MSVPLLLAQSLPLTVAQPPRIPLVLIVAVMKPLVEDCVPAGRMKSTVAAVLRVSGPKFTNRLGEVPVPRVPVATEAPELKVVLVKD